MPTGLINEEELRSIISSSPSLNIPTGTGLSYNQIAPPPKVDTLAESIAIAAGRTPFNHPDNPGWFMTALSELIRPQKALFAGMYTKAVGGTWRQAEEAIFDELRLFGTGKFKRDVQFSDILRPFSTPEERGLGLKTIGFAGDILIDPLFAVSKAGRALSSIPAVASHLKGARSLATVSGLKIHEAALSIPKAGPLLEYVEKVAFETFSTNIKGPINELAQDTARKLRARFSFHKDAAMETVIANAKVLRQISEDAGIPVAQLEEHLLDLSVKNKWGDKSLHLARDGNYYSLSELNRMDIDDLDSFIAPPALQTGLRRDTSQDYVTGALRTLEKEMKEMGMEKYVSRVQRQKEVIKAGIMNDRKMRKAFIHKNVDELEKEIGKVIPPEARENLVDLVSAMKESRLINVIDDVTPRLTAGKKFGRFKDIRLSIRNSLQEDYAHLATTPQAKKILASYPGLFNKFADVGYEFSPKHVALLRRSIDNVGGMRKANEASLAGELKLIDTDGTVTHITEKFQMFETNPIISDTLRFYYTQKAVTSIKLLESFAEESGVVITDKVRQELIAKKKDIVTHLKEIGKDGWTSMGVPGFKNVYVPPEAAKLLGRHFNISKNEEVINKVFDSIGKLHNVWKVWTTMPFAEFHTRNLIGNQWNKILAGMHTLEIPAYSALSSSLIADKLSGRFPKAVSKHIGDNFADFTSKYSRAEGTMKLGGNVYKTEDLLLDVMDHGLLRTGQFGSAEIKKSIRATADKALGRAKKTSFLTIEGSPIFQAGLNIASFIEDTDRVALYLWALDQGMDQRAARGVVFDHLFDYDDLTDAERAIRRFVAPFYTWTRKNIPLQLEYLVKDPHKFSALYKIKQQFETDVRAGFAPVDRFIADFVSEGFNIRVSQDKDTGDYEYFLFDNWLPAADIQQLKSPKDFGKMVVNLLGPAWKTPIELIAQEFLFFDEDFGEKKELFLGVRFSDPEMVFIRNIRALTWIDSLIDNVNRGFEDGDPGAQVVAENLTKLLTGIRLYSQSPRRNASYLKFQEGQELGKLRSEIRSAQREGEGITEKLGLQQSEVERLREILRDRSRQ